MCEFWRNLSRKFRCEFDRRWKRSRPGSALDYQTQRKVLRRLAERLRKHNRQAGE